MTTSTPSPKLSWVDAPFTRKRAHPIRQSAYIRTRAFFTRAARGGVAVTAV